MKRLFVTPLLLLLCIINGNSQSFNGDWSGQLSVMKNKLSVVFHINTQTSEVTMDSPDQGAFGIHSEIDFIDNDSISLKIPVINAIYTGKKVDNVIKGHYTQNNMKFPLDLKKTKTELKRPQTPKGPFPYKQEEISFTGSEPDVTLSATLTYPVQYKESQKVPIVIFVSGSGLQDRDETIFEHKPFAVISDYFARHGIASLRYDDRGYGKSTGDAHKATTFDFAKDAEAAIKYARSLGVFTKVGLLGHSEGGTIGFILAADGKLDFLVSMAGAALDCKHICIQQFFQKEDVVLDKSSEDLFLNTLRSKGQLEMPWMKTFLELSPKKYICKITCPSLVINGGKDVQVYAKSNIECFKTNVNPTTNCTIKIYDGLNHLFQHCETGRVGEYYKIEETISPDVLKDITIWINQL